MSDFNNSPSSSDALQRTLNEMLATESVLEGRNGQQLRSTVESVVTDLLSDGQLKTKLMNETKVGFGLALGKFLAWKVWTELEKSDKKRAAAKTKGDKLTLRLPRDLLLTVKEEWHSVRHRFLVRVGFPLPEAVLEPGDDEWVLELRDGLLGHRILPTDWFEPLVGFLTGQASQLLTLGLVKQMIEEVKVADAVIGEEMERLRLPVTGVYKILENLLEDGIPIHEMGTILTAVVLAWEHGSDRPALMSAVRKALSPWICRAAQARPGVLRALKIGPNIEEVFAQSARYVGSEQHFALEPRQKSLIALLVKKALVQLGGPEKMVVLVNHRLRQELRAILGQDIPEVVVMSETEIHRGFKVEVLAYVDFKENPAPPVMFETPEELAAV